MGMPCPASSQLVARSEQRLAQTRHTALAQIYRPLYRSAKSSDISQIYLREGNSMFGAFFSELDAAGCAGRRPRWGFEGFGESWWGGGPQRGRGHWRGRANRLFEQGDLKYVILRLLEEKPRHGYEIIKDLESRFGGSYAH